jgi:Trp operon repressor
MSLLVTMLAKRDRASLERRVRIIRQFVPASWLSLRYESFLNPPRIVATADE